MKKKRHFLLLLWIPALLIFTACGAGQGKNEAVTETEKSTVTGLSISTDQPVSKTQEKKQDTIPPSEKKTVRIFLPDQSILRFRMDGEYLEEQFENAGFDAVTYYAGMDAGKQAAALKNAADLPTDLFILVPLDGREVQEAAQEIRDTGIPLILYDQPLSDMEAAAFFVGFRDSDVAASLEEVRTLEEAYLLAQTEAEENETESEEGQGGSEEEQNTPEKQEQAEETTPDEDTAETEMTEDPLVPLLGVDEETDVKLLAGLKDGERQAVVYRDTAGEAVAVLDIGINLLRDVTPDAGLIAASGWGFPCEYQEGVEGVSPAAFYLQPVLVTADNMEEVLVVPGYYAADADGYLRPGQAE